MKYLKLAIAAFLFTGTGAVTNVNAQVVEKSGKTSSEKNEIKNAVSAYASVLKSAGSTDALNKAYEKVAVLMNKSVADTKAIVAVETENAPEMKKYESKVNRLSDVMKANAGKDKAAVLSAMNAFVEVL